MIGVTLGQLLAGLVGQKNIKLNNLKKKKSNI